MGSWATISAQGDRAGFMRDARIRLLQLFALRDERNDHPVNSAMLV